MTDIRVLDASVGVKWFQNERGSASAVELLHAVASGALRIVVPTHFAHETLSVIGREGGGPSIVRAWEVIRESGVEIVPLTDEVVREAAAQCDILGCSFYDALAPAVASLLGATLVSADVRAHGAYPGVHLLA